MGSSAKEGLADQYREFYASIPREAFELDLRLTVRTIQALAEGKPISPKELAEIWQMSLDQVSEVLARAAAAGSAELDSQGNLVAGVLSLTPTAHRILIDGNELYAWCAYDAIYAPSVAGKTARIESRDPVTGADIGVAVSPEGIREVRPDTAVVTVVGVIADMRAGPESPRCSQMLFFESRESAEEWLQGRSNVSILTIEETFELAQELQLEPAKRLGLV